MSNPNKPDAEKKHTDQETPDQAELKDENLEEVAGGRATRIPTDPIRPILPPPDKQDIFKPLL